jgi:DNA-binding NarL/FixJ family response regulator
MIEAEDDGDEITLIELKGADTFSPEDGLVEKEAQDAITYILSNFSPDNQTLVKMLYAGYAKSEIADKLHISRPAVSQRIQTITKQFASLVDEF